MDYIRRYYFMLLLLRIFHFWTPAICQALTEGDIDDPLLDQANSQLTVAHDEIVTYTLKFFIDPALATGLTDPQVRSRLRQYADDINFIFAKQTRRRFVFDPDNGTSFTTQSPFFNSALVPENQFEAWLFASLTDQPGYGSYHGYMHYTPAYGPGADALYWDAIHDPSTLQDESAELGEYWRQIRTIVHELEHYFGAGIGEYYNLLRLSDNTGVEPIHNVNIDDGINDPFWGARQDYWADPLMYDIYRYPLVGAPSSLVALKDATNFANVTVAIINKGPFIDAYPMMSTVPDLFSVKVYVKDAPTGLSINGATVQAWSIPALLSNDPTTLTVNTDLAPWQYSFRWMSYPRYTVFGNGDNMKLIKVHAENYISQFRWVSLYDCQAEKLLNNKNTMEINLDLQRAPTWTSLPTLPPTPTPTPSWTVIIKDDFDKRAGNLPYYDEVLYPEEETIPYAINSNIITPRATSWFSSTNHRIMYSGLGTLMMPMIGTWESFLDNRLQGIKLELGKSYTFLTIFAMPASGDMALGISGDDGYHGWTGNYRCYRLSGGKVWWSSVLDNVGPPALDTKATYVPNAPQGLAVHINSAGKISLWYQNGANKQPTGAEWVNITPSSDPDNLLQSVPGPILIGAATMVASTGGANFLLDYIALIRNVGSPGGSPPTSVNNWWLFK